MKLYTRHDEARRDALNAQLERIARRGEDARDVDALDAQLEAIERKARARTGSTATMRKQVSLFIDQHGARIFAYTPKELCEKAGGGKVSKMYVDLKAGGTVHVGYVIGSRWFEEYKRVERKV